MSFFVFFSILPQLDVRLAKIHKEGRRRPKKFYEAIVKGTQCEHHTLRSRDPHAQGLSQVPGRGLLGQTGQAHEEDHQVWVDDLIDIAVINTATLVQGGSV
ncbi:hypothetical protein B0H14DRAFT_2693805 [Mycena olivaceomarginata]|nr:hypothetical protein B0H14DRAFT_2693805 [Mycena olivaceomarginata]